MQEPLTATQEAEAQELATALTEAAREDLLAMARVLVAGPPEAAFGENELRLRDLAHRVAAKALRQSLERPKKGATRPA